MKQYALWFFAVIVAILSPCDHSALAAELPDIRTVTVDLAVPAMTEAEPAAGRRVRQVLPAYKESEVHHALYLPVDWKPSQRWPVIVEYPGNGPFRNRWGDQCTGRPEDCNLGYGISAGRGYIWVCLPYISRDHRQNQLQWWGDADATVQYCKDAVRLICERYGGDPNALILAGFSRGSIACNYIGLRDDEIARLWRGFICHSHYDGVRQWNYSDSDRRSAAARLARLDGRRQWISHEGSITETRKYLEQACPDGDFTFRSIPYKNHTDSWTLRDISERRELREFCEQLCK